MGDRALSHQRNSLSLLNLIVATTYQSSVSFPRFIIVTALHGSGFGGPSLHISIPPPATTPELGALHRPLFMCSSRHYTAYTTTYHSPHPPHHHHHHHHSPVPEATFVPSVSFTGMLAGVPESSPGRCLLHSTATASR